VSGITPADQATNIDAAAPTSADISVKQVDAMSSSSDMDAMMEMHIKRHTVNAPEASGHPPVVQRTGATSSINRSSKTNSLNGCLTIAADGKAILNMLQSAKTYRLEAQPFLFSQNTGRLVHVSGYFGSVLAMEDPRLPSFVVSTVDMIAPNCNVKISAAQIQRILLRHTESMKGIVA
jgi:hypothetical protein